MARPKKKVEEEKPIEQEQPVEPVEKKEGSGPDFTE